MLGRATWLPTPEDVVVQKLRWGRNKDLDDARDVLAVQGPETLDMGYIRRWCAEHSTAERLKRPWPESRLRSQSPPSRDAMNGLRNPDPPQGFLEHVEAGVSVRGIFSICGRSSFRPKGTTGFA